MSDKEKEDLKEILKDDLQEKSKEESAQQEDNTQEDTSYVKEEYSEDTSAKKDFEEKLDEALLMIEELKAEKEKYLKSLQMERADFDNFRKRNKTAVSEAMSAAKADVICEILPVVDSFERALSADIDREDAFVKGMELVLSQLSDILKKAGIKETPSLGEKFDPHLHEAVMIESGEDGTEPQSITEVFS